MYSTAGSLPGFVFTKGIFTSVYAVEVMFCRVCVCVCLSVSLSICLSVCLSVCLSARVITFDVVDIEISSLLWWYILTMPRLSLSIKVIGSRSRPSHGKY